MVTGNVSKPSRVQAKPRWKNGIRGACSTADIFIHFQPPSTTFANLRPHSSNFVHLPSPLSTFVHIRPPSLNLCPPLPTFAHLCPPSSTFRYSGTEPTRVSTISGGLYDTREVNVSITREPTRVRPACDGSLLTVKGRFQRCNGYKLNRSVLTEGRFDGNNVCIFSLQSKYV